MTERERELFFLDLAVSAVQWLGVRDDMATEKLFLAKEQVIGNWLNSDLLSNDS